MDKEEREERNREIIAWSVVAFLALILILLFMWALPLYGVYKQRLEGRAILAHAQFSREVAVAEAKAKMEAASLLAQADVERAKGTAEANKIIGESITPNYLRWSWIQGMQTNQMQVVYVPTEANLPIMEAGKRGNWGDHD